ncbi:MAG: PRC-barrel domain-containing protein [Acidothermaceae bacterium]
MLFALYRATVRSNTSSRRLFSCVTDFAHIKMGLIGSLKEAASGPALIVRTLRRCAHRNIDGRRWADLAGGRTTMRFPEGPAEHRIESSFGDVQFGWFAAHALRRGATGRPLATSQSWTRGCAAGSGVCQRRWESQYDRQRKGVPEMVFAAENLRDWRGHAVIDNAGAKIGVLESVYVDTVTDEPVFATVKLRGFASRPRLVFVPLLGATVAPQHVRVMAEKDEAKAAPSIAIDGELPVEDEPAVFAHYKLPYDVGPQGARRLGRR